MAASRDLGAHALRLYLYLASNADGYPLALSPADIRQRIGMPTSTYRDQFHILVDKGYLVANSSNGYDFFEVPQTRHAVLQSEKRATLGIDFENYTADVLTQAQTAQPILTEGREINNTENDKNIVTNIERVVVIPSPTAEGNKRPEHTPKEKKEFVF